MLTINKAKKMNICQEALEWGEEIWNGKEVGSIEVLKRLIKEKKYDWADWLIVEVMTRPQYLKYAIYSAKQVIGIFEKKYPDDDRPRKAIEAAEKVLKSDTEENRRAAHAAYIVADAAHAAYIVADAADAAADAAYTAYTVADTAYTAAYAAAYAAADATYAATYAAADAADAAADAAYAAADAAADAAKKNMQLKILNYGLKILRRKK